MSVFLDQFVIHTIIPINIMGIRLDFTNASLSMLLAVGAVMALLSWSTVSNALVPSRAQAFGEVMFEFIKDMVNKVVGSNAEGFIPLIFSLAAFVAGCNVIGLIPGVFTATSHVAVTFALSTAVIAILTIYGITKQGFGFFGIFLPQGVPLWLAPLIVIIEVVTYVFRTVSLSLRLTANMVAGHIMIKVIAVLGANLAFAGLLAAPITFLAGLTVFEFLVAILQAYIFAILSCVYISDAFKKH